VDPNPYINAVEISARATALALGFLWREGYFLLLDALVVPTAASLDWYRLIPGSCLMVTAGGESGTKIVDAVAAADIVAALVNSVVGAVAAEVA